MDYLRVESVENDDSPQKAEADLYPTGVSHRNPRGRISSDPTPYGFNRKPGRQANEAEKPFNYSFIEPAKDSGKLWPNLGMSLFNNRIILQLLGSHVLERANNNVY